MQSGIVTITLTPPTHARVVRRISRVEVVEWGSRSAFFGGVVVQFLLLLQLDKSSFLFSICMVLFEEYRHECADRYTQTNAQTLAHVTYL